MKKTFKILISLIAVATVSSCSNTSSIVSTASTPLPSLTSAPTSSIDPSTSIISPTTSIATSTPVVTTPIITTPTPTTPSPSTPNPTTPAPTSNPNITISSDAGNYYNIIDFTKSPSVLKTDLHSLISSNYNSISYNGLKFAFFDTDVKENGKIWDMYSNYEYEPTESLSSSYPSEGAGYNREHSVPNSWFNGNKNADEYSDLFHLYPTDGYVNNARGNYPYGEVETANYTSGNGSKRGNSNKYGYTGTVFEPLDEYKGDFARSYFYFCTRYEGNAMTTGNGNVHFTAKGVFPGLTQYSIDLFLTWDALDPVSEKEIKRNNIIYEDYQHNRNPFIDIQGLSTYLWGDLKSL